MEDSGKLESSEDKLVLRGQQDSSILPIIEKAKQKGWKSISVSGNYELCRAVWFEGQMAGLDVKGYRATQDDETLLKKMEEQRRKLGATELKLLGGDIARDYNLRVIPLLQKRYDELRKKRTKLGVTTTDTDRAYGINLPKGYAREVDEKFDRAKGAFLRAIDARDYFLSAQRENIPVKLSFEDGVARFVIRSGANYQLEGPVRALSRRQW